MFDLIVEAMAAWNQVGLLIGAGLFGGIGVLLLGNRIYWRLSAVRVSGTVIGVRQTDPRTFYPVYRYVSPTGETVEATSDVGSNSTSRMQTGTQVGLLVFKSHPNKVADANSYVVEIVSAIMTTIAVGLGYFAFTAWPVTRITWIVLAGTVIYAANKLHGSLRPKGERPSLSAWRSKNQQQLEGAPVRPLEEVLSGDLSAAQRSGQTKMSPAMPPILVIVGIVLLAVSVHFGHTLVRLQAIGQRVPGTVVRLQLDSGSENQSTYHPVVRFSVSAGQQVEFKDGVGTNPPSYHANDTVTVLYAPDSPQGTAIIDRGFWNWLPTVLLCLFGAILVAAGLQVRRKRELAQAQFPATR